MKIYRARMMGDFDADLSRAIWFSRRRDFSKHKRKLMDEVWGDNVSPEPELETFEVPPNKAALIAFLNRQCDR